MVYMWGPPQKKVFRNIKRVSFCTIGPINSDPEYVQGDVCPDARQKYVGRILSSGGSDRPFSIQLCLSYCELSQSEFSLNSAIWIENGRSEPSELKIRPNYFCRASEHTSPWTYSGPEWIGPMVQKLTRFLCFCVSKDFFCGGPHVVKDLAASGHFFSLQFIRCKGFHETKSKKK